MEFTLTSWVYNQASYLEFLPCITNCKKKSAIQQIIYLPPEHTDSAFYIIFFTFDQFSIYIK